MKMIEIEKELIRLSNEKNKEYIDKVVPNINNSLGVRIPELRKLARVIVKDNYKDFLDNFPNTYFDYVVLKGIVLGYVNDDIDVILDYVRKFIPLINDWAVNDIFCSSFKICKKYPDKVWNFLMNYVDVDNEYYNRLVAVMLLNYYLTDDYIDKALDVLCKLNNQGYYNKMAISWAFATAYTKYPDKALEIIKSNKLDKWIHNKTIQKCLDSYKVSKDDKGILRNLKR
jgi:3-methyladenine DNA glycosylase AlkD